MKKSYSPSTDRSDSGSENLQTSGSIQVQEHYLAIINQTMLILKNGKSTDDTLRELCAFLPTLLMHPAEAAVRIRLDNLVVTSAGFADTEKSLSQSFETNDGRKGEIELIYTGAQNAQFSNDERSLLDSVTHLLTGFLNTMVGKEEKYFTRERLKELSAINQTTAIIRSGKPPADTLRQIAYLLPAAWQFPEFTVARITYDTVSFTSPQFRESEWVLSSRFDTIDGKQGSIEVFYLRRFPESHEGPFLKEERDLIDNLSAMVAGYLNGVRGKEEKHSFTERLKELSAINQTTAILREKKPIDDTLGQIANILPSAWQHPQFAQSRIRFEDKEYTTPGFTDTRWHQVQEFETIDGKKGSLEVCYTRQFPNADEGPFIKEERQLLSNLANIITGYLNGIKGRDVLKRSGDLARKSPQKSLINSRQLLQKFLNRNNYNRDIFHDLMPFKVREILLVANLYDAYSIEKEGRFSEHILGEYYQMNLTSVPRITGVSSFEEAMEQLEVKHFDLIILMVGVDKNQPFDISRRIREAFPYIPIYVLLNSNADIRLFEPRKTDQQTAIDKVFVWNGDSKVFFAMVKHLEDRVNVENDTRVGMVRVILLVEDSSKYYSRYLPLLYSNVMEQTRRLIEDVNTDELFKVLKLRGRPKILLAADYEEAMEIFSRYREFMLCLITDVKFSKEGEMSNTAGFELVKEVRSIMKDLPIIIQSSDAENAHQAFLLKASFIDKNSDSLVQDVKYFISTYLGFGSFVYKDSRGRPIATARTLREFEKLLRTIPDDSLHYHARRNHFSLWFMARGEIQIARIIYPFKLEHFENPNDIRKFLLDAIQQHRSEQNKGKVIPYEENMPLDETNIVTLTSGSLGGKGRGLAFINTLIYNFDFQQLIPNINIRAPRTFIIGSDEFESFMERNELYTKVLTETDYEAVKQLFLAGKLSEVLTSRLRRIIRMIDSPLAVRSSGLFEDSLNQPFAGIFETYLLPNNHADNDVRLQQCMDAIRLVFASVFSPVARGYIRAVNYKLEEEKMAVVLQEVAGNRYEDAYYPHISGVAQSYNYYPFGHMKPEEGFSVLALGLGRYVVEGEKAYRFSPKYPTLENASPRDQFRSSQTEFFAVNMHHPDINLNRDGEEAGLMRLTVDDAERHGTLKHCASVFNPDNNTITPGLSKPGPRIVNFADVLKYNYVPLSRTIEVVLDVVKEAMGSPVEIEFAVDLNRDANYRSTFYLLQIKPLIGNAQDYNINTNEINPNDVLLWTDRAMGNGLIDDVEDVIYVDPALFDKTKTLEMAAEAEQLNRMMEDLNRRYLLIGPGRWGTRDRFIGIPVNWPQISHARVIVETSLEDFPLDASSGSHFFHNVTSMNVGYFSVQQGSPSSYINWDKLAALQPITTTRFFRHVRIKSPLQIKMDGRKRLAVALFTPETPVSTNLNS